MIELTLVTAYGNMGCSSFQAGGRKLERFLPKNQHCYQKEIIEFLELV